jgi:elongation factor G
MGQMMDKLRLNCAPVQIPIGLEDQLTGLVDLISMKAFVFDGSNGETVKEVDTIFSLHL